MLEGLSVATQSIIMYAAITIGCNYGILAPLASAVQRSIYDVR